MSRWMIYNKGADFQGLAKSLGVDPVIVRLMVNRDVPPDKMDRFLNAGWEDLHDPHLLKDSDRAAEILKEARDAGEKIRVIGDYDIDGIFSTYILYSGLSFVGADVDYDIPHRIKDGYGMSRRLVEKAIADEVDLIITCDNGIKEFDEIAMAKEHGIKVVVTDHHELDFDVVDGEKKEKLPDADAVVNPHRSDCPYPFKDICGAVVAWKLVQVLHEECGVDTQYARSLIGFAAFATIGDIMPLVDENRAIVKTGLMQIKPDGDDGMGALIRKCFGDDHHMLDSFDVGFVVGPCFNAAGRLDSAMRGMDLLLCEDTSEAILKAQELYDLNAQRKNMTEQGEKDAREILEREGRMEDDVVVVYVPGLHESLAGIVAGRLKESLYRPVFVITDGEEGVKGSGRSIPGYSMAEKLHDAEDILTRYGGHPMAAGVSMPKDNIDLFRETLNKNADIPEEFLEEKLMIDMELPLSYLSERFIRGLDVLKPYGEKNPGPLFAVKNARPKSYRMIGQGRFVKFEFGSAKPMEPPVEAVYFGDGQELIEKLTERFGQRAMDDANRGRNREVTLTFTYVPGINEYRGKRTIQARIKAVL